MTTIFKCAKCGKSVEKESGIIGTHKNGKGQMVIRCVEHITESAIRNLARYRDRALARSGMSVDVNNTTSR